MVSFFSALISVGTLWNCSGMPYTLLGGLSGSVVPILCCIRFTTMEMSRELPSFVPLLWRCLALIFVGSVIVCCQVWFIHFVGCCICIDVGWGFAYFCGIVSCWLLCLLSCCWSNPNGVYFLCVDKPIGPAALQHMDRQTVTA